MKTTKTVLLALAMMAGMSAGVLAMEEVSDKDRALMIKASCQACDFKVENGEIQEGDTEIFLNLRFEDIAELLAKAEAEAEAKLTRFSEENGLGFNVDTIFDKLDSIFLEKE